MLRTTSRAAMTGFAILALAGAGAGSATAVERELTTIAVPPLQPAGGEVKASSVACVWKYSPGRNPTVWVDCHQVGGGAATGFEVTVTCSDGSSHTSGATRFGSPAMAYCPGATTMKSFTLSAHY
ncbi:MULTISPECIES: hypothetical protein [Actinosynnema]|uniref:hypothetical protein n=1 Tax=Actinosynnema TaxID=40566 RepID=UPI0012FE6297|nr:hypothetical protein [Actinosynnema pretiosum]